MFAFQQEGERLTACIQGTLDNLWAFGNENTFFGFMAVKQLVFAQAGIDIQFGSFKVCNFYNV